jgi:hypothetical protein
LYEQISFSQHGTEIFTIKLQLPKTEYPKNGKDNFGKMVFMRGGGGGGPFPLLHTPPA